LDGRVTTSTALPLLGETVLATTRYLGALTGLDERSWREPSLLPGWTRAHVVAHLARNAEAFSRVLQQTAAGEPAWMYESQEARERDIAETVERLGPEELLHDARASSQHLEAAWRASSADPATPYTRLPGEDGSFPLSSVGPRRLAEVEIHHADLGLDYEPADWPLEFSTSLIAQRQGELAVGGGVALVLAATDVEGRWPVGSSVGDGAEVVGRAGDLAWWLVGRGDGSLLTCSPGPLPVLGRWR
jgi:maleylpyruvate isomerase